MSGDGLPTTGSIGTLLADLDPEQRPVALAAIRCAFAGLAMHALIQTAGRSTPHEASETAVVYADQLLSKLANSTNELFTQGGGA